MQNIIRLFVLSATVLVLTSCGGIDSKGEISTTPENLSAIESIAKYEKVPTVEQYINAGITGVTADNLDEINAIVESSAYEDIDTQAEIQALVDGLSVKDNGKTPVITLIGANPQSIKLGTPYVELNASTNDGSIHIDSSAVDINTLGKYSVTYTATSSNGKVTQVSRTVNVIEAVIVDTKFPVITLKGENPLNLKTGDNYIETGANATDDVDGDVSASIIIGGDTVDTNTAGTYTVTYNVSDEKGNKAVEVKRTVNITNVLVLHEATDVIHKTISKHTLSKNEVVTIENTIFKSIGTNDTTEAIRIAGDGTQTVKLKNLQFENEGIPIYITNVKKVVAEGINCLNVGGCIVMDEIEDVDIKYVQIKNWGIVKVKGWDLRESYTKDHGNLNAISVRSEQPGKYHYRNTKSFNLGHVLIDNSENNPKSLVKISPECTKSVKIDYISTTHLNAGKDGYGYIHDVYAIGNDTDTRSAGLVPFDQNNKNITYENIYGFNVAAYCFGGWGGTHMTFKNSMCVTTEDHGRKLYPDQSQGSCDRGDDNTALGISLKIPNNKDTFDIRDLVFDHVLINTPGLQRNEFTNKLEFINKTMMYTLNMLDDRNVTFPNSNISFTTFPDSVYDDGNPPTANRYGLEEWGDTPKEEVTEDRILDIIKGKKGTNDKRPSMFQTHGKSAGFLPVDW